VKVVAANRAHRRVSGATGLHLPEALPATRQMTTPGAVDATRWLNGLVADGTLFRRWGRLRLGYLTHLSFLFFFHVTGGVALGPDFLAGSNWEV